MRLLIFTSNALRHKYLSNTLGATAAQVLTVVECKPADAAKTSSGELTPLEAHFNARYEAEKKFFGDHTVFASPTLPLLQKEANLPSVYDAVKAFKPDAMVVFGASILKDQLLNLLPPGRSINLHLGLSPYYRGAGTNFWPFVNKELEYVGSTLLHIDSGVDTGDIIAHVLPTISPGDNVHTIGCKVIKSSVDALARLIAKLKAGETLPRLKQWDIPNARYYKKADFNESVLNTYLSNLQNGLIENHLKQKRNAPRLVRL